jgi:hypothetical protein
MLETKRFNLVLCERCAVVDVRSFDQETNVDRRRVRVGGTVLKISTSEQVGTTFGLLFRVAPGRGIRPSASVRPTGLTQGELVLRGWGCLRPTASDTHQSWGGATNNKKCISPLKGRILLFATSEKVESDEFELSTIVLT